jgi:hypothetical protein
MAVKTVYPEPEPDPFDNFSFAELLAFIHKTQFASGLASFFLDFDDPQIREILRANNLGDVRLTRELLIDAADELSRMRLDKCAALVMEEAWRRPSSFGAQQEHQQQRWQQQRRYYLATGKRQSMIPPEPWRKDGVKISTD